jgi:hypothetical protein
MDATVFQKALVPKLFHGAAMLERIPVRFQYAAMAHEVRLQPVAWTGHSLHIYAMSPTSGMWPLLSAA